MSYQHFNYQAQYDARTDWDSAHYTARHEGRHTEYFARVYTDGWTSVDGDEWWGEFPTLDDAEKYLGVTFEEMP